MSGYDKKSIFVVDDEPDLCDVVGLHLTQSGFRVRSFLNAMSFLRALESDLPDLIVLDLMLPDMDGIDVCRYLKSRDRTSEIPIIMLTARGDEADRVLGLEIGADDYIVKPFFSRELVARVRAVLRRAEKQNKNDCDRAIIEIGDCLKIDEKRFEVFVNGKNINLTPTEFRLLLTLVKKMGWVFSREQLIDALWGNEKIVLDRTIDVHIKNLREKLGVAGRLIKSVRGIGYKIVDRI